jgi:hypothetical protein
LVGTMAGDAYADGISGLGRARCVEGRSNG